MLALCWHILRSRAGRRPLLAHPGRFYVALGRPGLDFGSSGQGFRTFKAAFDDVLWRSHARVAEMLIMQQHHIFAMFYKLRNMPHTATEHVFGIAFKNFLDMVYGLLQKIPAGIHLLLFITTLQRSGTCAAHPPPPERRAVRAGQ